MIRYGLGTITYRSKDKEKNGTDQSPAASINIPITLSKDEYNSLFKSTKNVRKVFGYSYLFSTVQWNCEDLINTINAYLNAFIKKDAMFLTARDVSLNINKDILNTLTSFRFYLDYMDKNLKDDFGKSSGLVKKFNDLCSIEYDNNFSYRFIYHLRNYAQHKGILVNSVNFSKFIDKENPLKINHNLRISINRNNLIEDKNFKKELKPEIAKLPENIDPVEHIFNWLNSLERIHQQITNEIIPTGFESAKAIIDRLEELNFDPNDKMVAPMIFITNRSDENVKAIDKINQISLPITEAKKIIEHTQNNA